VRLVQRVRKVLLDLKVPPRQYRVLLVRPVQQARKVRLVRIQRYRVLRARLVQLVHKVLLDLRVPLRQCRVLLARPVRPAQQVLKVLKVFKVRIRRYRVLPARRVHKVRLD
jgi:hypothetical protein